MPAMTECLTPHSNAQNTFAFALSKPSRSSSLSIPFGNLIPKLKMFAVKSIAIVALAQLIAAAPTAYPAFVVNDLNAFQPSCRSDLGTIDDLSEVSFKVTDPSDSASTSCKANWACNQSDAYPSEYVRYMISLHY